MSSAKDAREITTLPLDRPGTLLALVDGESALLLRGTEPIETVSMIPLAQIRAGDDLFLLVPSAEDDFLQRGGTEPPDGTDD